MKKTNKRRSKGVGGGGDAKQMETAARQISAIQEQDRLREVAETYDALMFHATAAAASAGGADGKSMHDGAAAPGSHEVPEADDFFSSP